MDRRIKFKDLFSFYFFLTDVNAISYCFVTFMYLFFVSFGIGYVLCISISTYLYAEMDIFHVKAFKDLLFMEFLYTFPAISLFYLKVNSLCFSLNK